MGRFYSVIQDEECSGLPEKADALRSKGTSRGRGRFCLMRIWLEVEAESRQMFKPRMISSNVFYEGLDRKPNKSWSGSKADVGSDR